MLQLVLASCVYCVTIYASILCYSWCWHPVCIVLQFVLAYCATNGVGILCVLCYNLCRHTVLQLVLASGVFSVTACLGILCYNRCLHTMCTVLQPVLVSCVDKLIDGELWSPGWFNKEFGMYKNDLVNCRSGSVIVGNPMCHFWEGFESLDRKRPSHSTQLNIH